MTIQYINTGTASNQGDGDTLRTAFRKINDNFRELYDQSVPQIASATTAGIVKIGPGLSISGSGVLTVTTALSTSTVLILDNTGNPSIEVKSYTGTVVIPANNTQTVELFKIDKAVYKGANIDWFAVNQTNNTVNLGSGYMVAWHGNACQIFGTGMVSMDNQGNTSNSQWDATSATVTSTAVTIFAVNVSNTSSVNTVDWKAKVSLFRL
jgi:hypothetical protein